MTFSSWVKSSAGLKVEFKFIPAWWRQTWRQSVRQSWQVSDDPDEVQDDTSVGRSFVMIQMPTPPSVIMPPHPTSRRRTSRYQNGSSSPHTVRTRGHRNNMCSSTSTPSHLEASQHTMLGSELCKNQNLGLVARLQYNIRSITSFIIGTMYRRQSTNSSRCHLF